MSRWSLRSVPAGAIPGLSRETRAWLEGTWTPPTATAPLQALPTSLARGSAWTDPGFAAGMRRHHADLGAPPASLAALERLLTGQAGCVVTGQQPAVWGGSMMTVSKVQGAIALAQSLTARGVPCVPVYWCGADDSDFAEIRSAWLWSASQHEPFRSQLPDAMWSAGQRVGDISGAELAEVERNSLDFAGDAPGSQRLRTDLDALGAGLDLGRRTQAHLLRWLGPRGLVVVDARSPELRRLGRDLFADYARRHRAIADRLSQRSADLRAGGMSTPLSDDALRSGLFRLEGSHRTKLTPDELSAGLEGIEVSPSVLLRPVWQDALLAPAAAVLGPSEFAYHAQLAPLYEALGVRAAAPVPRPHLTLYPTGLPWPADADLPTWLAGGEGLSRRLAQEAVPSDWIAAVTKASVRRDEVRAGLLQDLGPGAASSLAAPWREQDERNHRRWLEDLRLPAWTKRTAEAPVWAWGPDWLAPRGVPQERILAAPSGWWRCGEAFESILDALGQGYVEAVERRASPGFVAVEEDR